MYQSRCTAKNSLWWAERLPETCRIVIPIKLEFSASVGLFILKYCEVFSILKFVKHFVLPYCCQRAGIIILLPHFLSLLFILLLSTKIQDFYGDVLILNLIVDSIYSDLVCHGFCLSVLTSTSSDKYLLCRFSLSSYHLLVHHITQAIEMTLL